MGFSEWSLKSGGGRHVSAQLGRFPQHHLLRPDLCYFEFPVSSKRSQRFPPMLLALLSPKGQAPMELSDGMDGCAGWALCSSPTPTASSHIILLIFMSVFYPFPKVLKVKDRSLLRGCFAWWLWAQAEVSADAGGLCHLMTKWPLDLTQPQ